MANPAFQKGQPNPYKVKADTTRKVKIQVRAMGKSYDVGKIKLALNKVQHILTREINRLYKKQIKLIEEGKDKGLSEQDGRVLMVYLKGLQDLLKVIKTEDLSDSKSITNMSDDELVKLAKDLIDKKK